MIVCLERRSYCWRDDKARHADFRALRFGQPARAYRRRHHMTSMADAAPLRHER